MSDYFDHLFVIVAFYFASVNVYCTVNLQAVLGASAIDNETNIVSVETKDFYMQDVKQPIISLTSGVTNSVTWQLCIK